MESDAEVQVSEFGIKAKSKKEVYNLLCNVGDVYFPPIEDAHYKFISQILVSGKLYIKCFQIKVCSVIQLKGLRVEVLLKFQKKTLTQKDTCRLWISQTAKSSMVVTHAEHSNWKEV